MSALNNRFSWTIRTERQRVSPDITQVYLELTSFCNLACTTCARHSIAGFKPRHLSPSLFGKVIAALGELPRLERVVLLGFGEALCHPRAHELLSALRDAAPSVVLVSNALLLDELAREHIVALPIDEVYLSWDDDINAAAGAIRRGQRATSFRSALEGLVETKKSRGGDRPLIGLQIVATRSTVGHVREIAAYAIGAGAERIVLSNLFPYTAGMSEEILYVPGGKPKTDLALAMRGLRAPKGIVIASQRADAPRRCPFVERGTAFISSSGAVSPCPELAYTHPAYYFGAPRTHRAFTLGEIGRERLGGIWRSERFVRFRESFGYFEFPDCTACVDPERCWHRTATACDCYGNPVPCGECLWAKGIVVCP
ncbi:MAG TPA: SPASM domain-containing protein [Spirochaetota bacterium]|nr:SPASM domain-containing protein [Spirochaetota bacterium]HPU88218.1 SPASM domain-containing protein [Spirochaetota bacterium]